MKVIIFSKDRPSQLDACLRSLKKNLAVPAEIFAIVKTSHEKYAEGYVMLDQWHDDVTMILETDFANDLKCVLSVPTTDTEVMFLVDDNIMTRPFEADDTFDFFRTSKAMTLSLRLGLNIRMQTKKDSVPFPVQFEPGDHLTWYWMDTKAQYWNYPMSVDGNIFRLAEVAPYIDGLRFNCPNALESEMSKTPLSVGPMLCYERSKVINIAINKVQNWKRRKPEDEVTPERLNDLWLDGFRINIDGLMDYETDNPNVHPVLEYERYD